MRLIPQFANVLLSTWAWSCGDHSYWKRPTPILSDLRWAWQMALAAMTVCELLALREQIRMHSRKRPRSKSSWRPERCSLAQTMRAIRQAITQPEAKPAFGKCLTAMLEQALFDHPELIARSLSPLEAELHLGLGRIRVRGSDQKAVELVRANQGCPVSGQPLLPLLFRIAIVNKT